MVTIKQKAFLCCILYALTPQAATANEDKALIKSIMKLRSDVETLYNKIDENKDNYKAQMKSYAMQIADNEAQINRAQTSLKLTEQELEKTRIKIASISNKKDYRPLINKAILSLKDEIKKGIPFKVEERLASVTKIEKDLQNNSITQEKALSLLWSSYDDVIRLSKEIGEFTQEITVDGKVKKAKIAKIGTVMMYFATPDEKVGYVTKVMGKYKYKVATEKKEKQEIVTLFDALKKQIRTGYFNLPNALVLRGGVK